MNTTEEKLWRRRANTAFFSALVSIALVLVVEGIFATAALVGKSVADNARKAVPMRLFLHDGIGEAQRDILMARLRKDPSIEEVTFTTKEAAAAFWQEKTGEDIAESLDGFNPLFASIEVRLRPEAINEQDIKTLRHWLAQEVIIAEISYPEKWLLQTEQNVRRLSMWAVPLGLLVILIGLYLIFTTIRLAIYAQRHSIRTMQLIGATDGFIRKPFMLRGLAQGGAAGVIAVLLLLGLFALVQQRLTHIAIPISTSLWALIALSMIVLGGLLGAVGSWIAVNRYLHKSLAELN